MRANGSNDDTHTDIKKINRINPKPGEIWELTRCLQSPLDFSTIEPQHVYSEAARIFLEGKSPTRYVMIVREPEPLINRQEWQEVSVMVLSGETNFLSNIDILIPKEISGVDRDLLAETWHILPMLTYNLLQPVGKRLSRTIYDVLIAIGDCHTQSPFGQASLRQRQGQTPTESPSDRTCSKAPVAEEIQGVGLLVGILKAQEQPEIFAFHQQEEAWSEVLSIPLSPYQSNLAGIRQAEAILDAALEIERILRNRNQTTS